MISVNILEACETGDVSWFKQQKDNGTLPDLSVEQGYSDATPIEYACRFGQLDVIKWLVEESGQRIRTKISPAISSALIYGHLHIVKWIWEDFTSASILAAKKFNFKPVENSIQIRVGNTFALKKAAAAGHVDIFKWLLPLTPPGNDFTIVAQRAAEAGQLETLKLIIGHPNTLVNLERCEGWDFAGKKFSQWPEQCINHIRIAKAVQEFMGVGSWKVARDSKNNIIRNKP